MITYLKNYLFDLKEFITNLDLKCQIPTLDLLLSHLEVGISPRQGRILHVFPLFLKLFYFIFIIDVLSFLFLWCSLLVLLGHKNFQMIFKKAKRNNRLLCTSSAQHHSPCRSQRRFKDSERSSRYRHGPTQLLPDLFSWLTTDGAESRINANRRR